MNFLRQATFVQSQGVASAGSIDQRSSFANDVPEQPPVVTSSKRYYKRKEIRRNRNKVRLLCSHESGYKDKKHE